MQIIQCPSEVQKRREGSWVAIGKWDGIHLGHQQLVRQIVKCARSNGGQSIVVSFDRHPGALLRPGSEPFQLQSIPERSAWLSALGVDIHLVIPFTWEFASLTPEKFVEDILLTGLNAREVTVGYNFRFGKGREGTPELLEYLCAPFEVEAKVAPPVLFRDEVISSTLIRNCLETGEVEKASQLLGRPATLPATANRMLALPTDQYLSYELVVDSFRQVPGPGKYQVEIVKGSYQSPFHNPRGYVGILDVERINRQRRCFLQIKESESQFDGQWVCVNLLSRITSTSPVEGYSFNRSTTGEEFIQSKCYYKLT